MLGLDSSTLAPTKTTVLFWDKYLGSRRLRRMYLLVANSSNVTGLYHQTRRAADASVEGREGHAFIDSVHLKGTERSGVHSQKRKGREEKWRNVGMGILRKDEKVAVGERGSKIRCKPVQ